MKKAYPSPLLLVNHKDICSLIDKVKIYCELRRNMEDM